MGEQRRQKPTQTMTLKSSTADATAIRRGLCCCDDVARAGAGMPRRGLPLAMSNSEHDADILTCDLTQEGARCGAERGREV
eukprot:364569-Chlamydomonas_euryale.AAC.25